MVLIPNPRKYSVLLRCFRQHFLFIDTLRRKLGIQKEREYVVRPRNRTTETAIFCQSYHCDRCMLIHCCSNSLGVKYPSAE